MPANDNPLPTLSRLWGAPIRSERVPTPEERNADAARAMAALERARIDGADADTLAFLTRRVADAAQAVYA